MPSPVAHLSVGVVLWCALRRRLTCLSARWRGGEFLLLGLFLFFSMMPDLDSVVGLLAGDFGRYHNQATHSLLFGAAVTLLLAALAARLVPAVPFRVWTLVMTLPYLAHVAMDAFTHGRGVKLLWPLTDRRFQAPVELFGGVRWSRGWWDARHLVTLGEEIAFATLLFVVTGLVMRRHARHAGDAASAGERDGA